MRKSPAYALQQAIYNAMQTAGLVNIFHTVPAGQALPWIVIGDDQIIADYASADISECHATVHVFASSMPDVKALAGQVCDALDVAITLAGFVVGENEKVSERYLNENGGRNAHAVLEFMYRVQAI